jgi:transcriptional regulator with XRE-family HTH domain
VSYEALGDRIKKLRGDTSQTEFAKRYGLSKNTLWSYENETTDPKTSFVTALIEDFGIDANWLLLGAGEPPKPELTSVEAALLDNFRHCPEDEQDAIVKTSALLAKSKAKALKKIG